MENGKNCYSQKVFPIQPKQLTYCRKYCDLSSTNKLEQCAFCGIVEEESIIGSLIEVFLKDTRYPVALIEKVCCQALLNLIPSKVIEQAKEKAKNSDNNNESAYTRWIPEADNQKSVSDYYLCFNGEELEVYHSYVLSTFYSGWESRTDCYRCRRDNAFYLSCMESDINAARTVFQRKKAYKYNCDRSGTNLYEVAYPILNDGVCIAVLIIGQIKPDDYEKVKTKINENAKSFQEQMAERIALKYNNFLMGFINELIMLSSNKTFSASTDTIFNNELISKRTCGGSNTIEDDDTLPPESTDTDRLFYSIIGRVSSICDCIELYYNTPEDNADSCHILSWKNGKWSFNTKEENNPINNEEDLILAHNLNFFDDDIHKFTPTQLDAGKTCYIELVLRWGKGSCNKAKHQTYGVDSFANTLSHILHDTLMTQVSAIKQTMLAELMQNISHDLNQKIEIVNNHASVIDNAIERRSESIYDNVADYNKDIRNMLAQLRLFVNEARAKASTKIVDYNYSFFQPYGTFLFNLNEYYSSIARLQLRRYYSPLVSDVSFLEPNRYPEMNADPVMIERCVSNLLSNAAKHSYKYTNFYLDCYYDQKEDPDYYLIKVTNFCRPIPKEIADKVFIRGFCTSQAYSKPKGKGIGLAVVKEICERHGGTVGITSNKLISNYNIPVLFRIISEYGDSREYFCKRFLFDETQFDKLIDEYNRLQSSPIDESNHVAMLKKWPSACLLNEICAQGFTYDTPLTKRSINATINNPTGRITFTVKLPIKSHLKGDAL